MTRLNLEYLRNKRKPNVARAQGPTLQFVDRQLPTYLETTRRGFLRTSGLAFLNYSAITGGISQLSQLLNPGVEFIITESAVRVLCDGVERWKIDATRFAGSPRLITQRRQGYLRVQLINARYPGTQLPADLSCELSEIQHKWIMDLSLTLGGFYCRIPFEEWLTGKQPAEAPVLLDNRVATLALDGGLSLKGHGTLAFAPSWTLQISGTGITEFRNYHSDLNASEATISLVNSDWQGLAVHSNPLSRTVVEVARGGEAWNYTPPLGNLTPGCLVCQSTAFDALQVELWEDRERVGYAFLAEARADAINTTWFGNPNSATEGGWLSQGVTLAGSLYASVAPIYGIPEQRFWANLSASSLHLTHLGYGFEVCAPPEQPHFEIRRQEDQVEFTCSPIIKQVSVPLEGCIVEPIRISLGTRLPLSLDEQHVHEIHLRGMPPDLQPMGQGLANEERNGAHVFRVSNRVLDSDFRAALDPDKLGGLLLKIVRPDDLLVLKIRIYGFELKVSGSTTPKLIRNAKTLLPGSAKPIMLVYLPPQHIAEEVRKSGAPLDQVRAVPSNWSHLVFEIPDSMKEIPYQVESLLDWSTFEPVIAPMASSQFSGGGSGISPKLLATVTSIEAPSRLIISPNELAMWLHSRKAKLLNGRYELWHTRLSVKRLIDPQLRNELDKKPTVRAIFTPDSEQDSTPFDSSLTPKNRSELVQLQTCSPGNEKGSHIEVNQLMLSALGSSFDLSYEAQDQKCASEADLSAWKHRVVMGRDEDSRVTADGCLFPLGHRASLVTETKRTFLKYQGRMCAVLEITERIEVQKSVEIYSTKTKLQFPFQSIQIASVVTPKIKRGPLDSQIPTSDAFWVNVQDDPYFFHIVARDSDEASKKEWPQALVFVMSTVCNDSHMMKKINSKYQDDPMKRNEVQLNGQEVALVPYSERGEYRYRVERMRYGAEIVGSDHSSEDRPGFSEFGKYPLDRNMPLDRYMRQIRPENEGKGKLFKPERFSKEKKTRDPILNEGRNISSLGSNSFLPLIAEWSIRVPSIETLLKANTPGTMASAADVPIRITYHDRFVKVGFDKKENPREIFAKLLAPVPLRFSSDKVGGLAKPDIDIIGLSRSNGPVGGPGDNGAGTDNMLTALMTAKQLRHEENANANAVAAKDFFTSEGGGQEEELFNATLLGAISLKDIIEEADIPSLTTTVDPPPPARPEIVTTEYLFRVTKFRSTKLFRQSTEGETRLTILSRIEHNHVQTQSSGMLIEGTLTRFQLNFYEYINVNFKELRFNSTQGGKFDVSVSLHNEYPIVLGQRLGPFGMLSKVLEGAGLGNAIIEPTQDGIRVGLAIGLPPIATGFWSFENVKLRSALEISFAGRPLRLYFGFSSPEDPFQLAASLLGGGGYLEITASTRGLEKVKGALEFGGVVSINLYIVAAKAEILAGFYVELAFSGESSDPKPTLGGYWRVCAFVQLLQFISVSIEIGLGLAYIFEENRLVGTGWAVLRLDLLLYSETLRVEVSMKLDVDTLMDEFRGHLPYDPFDLVEQKNALVDDQRPFLHLVSRSRTGRNQVKRNTNEAQRRSSFSDLFSSKDWQDYAQAFAPGPWM